MELSKIDLSGICGANLDSVVGTFIRCNKSEYIDISRIELNIE